MTTGAQMYAEVKPGFVDGNPMRATNVRFLE
jgi:hypothetical protein